MACALLAKLPQHLQGLAVFSGAGRVKQTAVLKDGSDKCPLEGRRGFVFQIIKGRLCGHGTLSQGGLTGEMAILYIHTASCQPPTFTHDTPAMPVLLSAKDARLVAKACPDAAMDAERRASRLHDSTAYAQFLATAEKLYQLANTFERHYRTPSGNRVRR
jgi:hypothetical protein